MRDIQKRIQELRSEIKKHDELYYVSSKPVISDAEYDRLFLELKKLEAEHPQLVTIDSPTQKVGGSVASNFTKLKHKVPLLSLDSHTDEEDALAFDKRIKKDLNSDDEDELYDPNSSTKRQGPKINVRKNRW